MGFGKPRGDCGHIEELIVDLVLLNIEGFRGVIFLIVFYEFNYGNAVFNLSNFIRGEFRGIIRFLVIVYQVHRRFFNRCVAV